MKFAVRSVLLAVVLSPGLVACTSIDASPDPLPPASTAPTVPAAVEKASLSGAKVTDSFGNVDFYTTVDGDTLAEVADTFELSVAKLAQFNGLPAGATLEPGTKLRLIPAPGPTVGAKGPATEDADGIPTSYQVVDDDTLAGITYRFGITEKQLRKRTKSRTCTNKGTPTSSVPGTSSSCRKTL